MINILEQKVPKTASVGSFGGAGTSNNRTDNLYFEPFRSQSVSDYLDNISFGGAGTSNNRTDNPYFEPFRSQSVSDYLDNILHSISASDIRSLADKITLWKTAFTPEVDLALDEPALAFLKLKAISKSSGLTQATALRKIEALKNLPEDWDSYGANPISPNAIAKAKLIITLVIITFGGIIGNVVQLTDVIPIADGGVQLEWIGPHAELEIEISPNGNIGLLYISGSEDRRNYEESEDNSLNDVYAKIGRLIFSQYNN